MSTVAYPKVLQLGDKNVADIFGGPVEITEKLDGSQIGFGWVWNDPHTRLEHGDAHFVVRSHGREIYNEATGVTCDDKLFAPAVDYLVSIKNEIRSDLFYYGECLVKPRQSTLAYETVPRNYVSLFGARFTDGEWCEYDGLTAEADALDLGVVPLIFWGTTDVEDALKLLDRESCLGGPKIEGIVIKRYIPDGFLMYGQPQYVKAAKYVSERFKEVHKESWKRDNTSGGGIERIKEGVRTEARWRKAIQHLRENGEWDGSVRMIGPLMREVATDLEVEESDSLKEALWNVYRKEILRSATSGLAEWFKSELALGRLE